MYIIEDAYKLAAKLEFFLSELEEIIRVRDDYLGPTLLKVHERINDAAQILADALEKALKGEINDTNRTD